MGSSQGGTWSVEPRLLAALRLDKAHKALAAGKATEAIIEAEELLDEDPSHVDALIVVGAASLDLSESLAADAAFSRALELLPDHSGALAGLAVARFELADLEGSVAAAARATSRDPELVEAWYYQAMALERLGREDAAATAYQRAHSLDAATYPLVDEVAPTLWAEAMDGALKRLPMPLRLWYEDIPIEVDRFPSIVELTTSFPPANPTISALFVGTPPVWSESQPDVKPECVRLFSHNIQRIAVVERVVLGQVIAEALRLEALEWLDLGAEDHPLLPSS
jgi:tetratricopeptide (TPR) repeat protein